MSVRWIIQQNLGKRSDIQQLIDVCQRLGHEVVPIDVVPFSDALPDILNDRPTVVYGATTFVTSVHDKTPWRPGVFFDRDMFRYSRYLFHYGQKMLNANVEFTNLGMFELNGREPDELVFIRPDRDLKEFAGEVVRVGDFMKWKNDISHGGFTIDASCPIVVAEPVGISYEWRTFVVDGKVIAASQYRRSGSLAVSADVPERVIRFAEACAHDWSPAPVFVLDVGQSGDGLYVIELGCMNSAGFYACDLSSVVTAVSSAARRLFP